MTVSETLPRCPSWCQREPGHDWDDVWDTAVRYHRHTWPVPHTDYRVELELLEYDTPDGSSRAEPQVLLHVESPSLLSLDTAEAVRDRLTAALHMAAGGENYRTPTH